MKKIVYVILFCISFNLHSETLRSLILQYNNTKQYDYLCKAWELFDKKIFPKLEPIQKRRFLEEYERLFQQLKNREKEEFYFKYNRFLGYRGLE